MATSKLVLKDKVLSNGLYPIFLRITKDRKRKYISTGFSCEKSQWNDKTSEFRKNCPEYQQKNASILKLKNRCEKIFLDSFSDGKDLSINEFEEIFYDFKRNKKITVNQFWENKIEMLVKSKQTGNARAYKDAKRSFFKFLGSEKSIDFKYITPSLLNNYEVFLRSNNGTDGGISVKMRTIRALFNAAIKEKIASKDDYPFDVYKISKLKSSSNKRALAIEDMEKIKNFNCENYPTLLNSKNYFLFSYFTRGMNFYDMMMLTWSNIENEKIIYKRRKTKTNFSIKITPPVRKILDFYKENNKNNTSYIFPILLSDNLTPMQIEYRKDKVLKKFNKDLKKIAELCGIDAKITSYVARHSFATNLKQKGISTDIISEAMGHQNVSITQVYLKDLESSVIDEAMEVLL
ncbi:site-specific integrase [Cruoricaptor ignavus]|uniref:Site-specific integrase n=1 Tax=Cruoricaptor ignavus TaxID=1118202 RepID=A0A7M1T3J4_9FLAO|nr:site-specific integrase [Cruoricaptor ignavus]QOR73714.1 site-specific integrase [Cruoricaptor ignavus]